jgi:hypothetical protein
MAAETRLKERVRDLAKTLAAREWGRVQSMRQVIPGVWTAESSGHGGVVAWTHLADCSGIPDGLYGRSRGLITRQRILVNQQEHSRLLAFEEDTSSYIAFALIPGLARAGWAAAARRLSPHDRWMVKFPTAEAYERAMVEGYERNYGQALRDAS